MAVSIEDMSAWALFNVAGDGSRPSTQYTGAALTNLLNITSQPAAISSLGKLGANMSAEVLAVTSTSNTLHGAQAGTIDNAIYRVSRQRADLGALQNRLEHTFESLTVTQENITAAESNIRDTDMAKEMITYTKFSILQQTAQAMLAQANQAPQAVLQLIR
jgi:flagellin